MSLQDHESEVHGSPASRKEVCKYVSWIFSSGTAHLYLGFKNHVFKAKVMSILQKIRKFSKFFKMPAITLVSSLESIRWSTCKKNGVKALKRSNSGQSELKTVLKVNVKTKTLESGFGKLIFSNWAYKE